MFCSAMQKPDTMDTVCVYTKMEKTLAVVIAGRMQIAI